MTLHQCGACKKKKPLSEFYLRRDTVKPLPRNKCKTCWNPRTGPLSLKAFLFKLVSGRRNKTKHPFNLSVKEVMLLWKRQDGKCALTGRTLTVTIGSGHVPTNASLDRIDPALGYTIENVWLVCNSVNILKGRLTVPDLLIMCSQIMENSCNEKEKNADPRYDDGYEGASEGDR